MKKGFTLVELLAVVTILGILATIGAVSYLTINNRHKKTSCENLKKHLENSAVEYVQDYNLLHSKQFQDSDCGCAGYGYCICVSYNVLYEKGYIEEDLKSGSKLKNPVTGKTIDDFYIRVEINNKNNYFAKIPDGKLSCD